MTEPLIVQKLGVNLNYLGERQTLLSRNIANIDTPDYQAKDLRKLDFNNIVRANHGTLEMRTTSPKHIAPTFKHSRFEAQTRFKAVQEKPGGNTVILEEQMGKISDVSAQHQMSSTLLRKFHSLYRTAVTNKI